MKNSKPKVSVVTITYAHEKYIEDTLRGVLMQQYDGPIEFIIANDNSPDQTDEVVKKFFDTHPIPENIEIKYTCHQENKGMMPNFIWALEQATGEYIALCEGDDYWTDPLKLQKQVDFLEANNQYMLCYTDFSVYDVKKNRFKKDRFKDRNSSYRHPKDYIDFLCGKMYIAPCSWVFCRDLLDKVDLPTDCVDGTFYFAVSALSFTKFKFLSFNSVTYRILPESASQTSNVFLLYLRIVGLLNTQLQLIKKLNLNNDINNKVLNNFYKEVAQLISMNADANAFARIYDHFNEHFNIVELNKALWIDQITFINKVRKSVLYLYLAKVKNAINRFL